MICYLVFGYTLKNNFLIHYCTLKILNVISEILNLLIIARNGNESAGNGYKFYCASGSCQAACGNIKHSCILVAKPKTTIQNTNYGIFGDNFCNKSIEVTLSSWTVDVFSYTNQRTFDGAQFVQPIGSFIMF